VADYFGQMLKLIQGRQKTDAAEATAAAKLMAVPELQDSHGGLGRAAATLQQADKYFSDTVGGIAANPGAVLMGLANDAQQTVTLPAEVYRGEVDPRSDEGIARAFNMAGNVGLSARAAAAVPGAVPDNTLGMFIGRNAANADLGALSRAEALEAAGKPRDDIWRETLWGRGAEGEWRSEIDDSKAVIGDIAMRDLQGTGTRGATNTRAPAFLWHGEHWRNYPEARKIQVEATYDATRPRMGGAYNAGGWDAPPRVELDLNAIEGQQGPRSIMLHELMHDVQRRENFARGGASSDFSRAPVQEASAQWSNLQSALKSETAMRLREAQGDIKALMAVAREDPDGYQAINSALNELGVLNFREADEALAKMAAKINEIETPEQQYRRLAGEVEARNVQARRDMSMDERRARPPWETEDVPRDRQIVRR
jgi:hypothetical protein